jgi:hypothetical protein
MAHHAHVNVSPKEYVAARTPFLYSDSPGVSSQLRWITLRLPRLLSVLTLSFATAR